MSPRYRRYLMILILLALLLPGAAGQGSQSVLAQESGVALRETAVDGLVFDVTIPEPALETVTAAGRNFERLSLPGYSPAGQPGQPELVETGIMIGVPAGAKINVQILDSRSRQLPGEHLLYPAPAQEAVYDAESGRPDLEAGVQERFVWDAGAYERDAFSPAAVVSVEETAMLRQQQVARLAIRPVQYNPARRALRVYRSLRVQVRFSGVDVEALNAAGQSENDAFEPLLRGQLLNYEQARPWRLARQSLMAGQTTPVSYPGDASQPWLKSWIQSEGLYKIVPADFEDSALIDIAAVDPANLQVWHGGVQIPVDFLGDSDAVFEDGEALVFYASDPQSYFSLSDVYWVTVGSQPGLRMEEDDGSLPGVAATTNFPASRRIEEDKVFLGDLPGWGNSVPSRWYWQELHNLFTPNTTITVDLNDVIIDNYAASLEVGFVGVTYLAAANPDHHVSVDLNGQHVGDLIWDGQTGASETFTFPAAWLIEGRNEIELSLPGDLAGVNLERAFLDGITLGYRQRGDPVNDVTAFIGGSGIRQFDFSGFRSPDILAYNVTDSFAPRRVSNLVVTAEVIPPNKTRPGQSTPALDENAHHLFLPAMQLNAPLGNYRVQFGSTTASSAQDFIIASQLRLLPLDGLEDDAPSSLQSTAQQADYLLIAHRDFWEAAEALAAHRENNGLSVALVDIQDVYDEFSGGRLDPNAIRDFVQYAYSNWQAPAPAYLLLFGDAHYDYRMISGQASFPNFVPTYFDCFDPWLCEVASDNEFVAVSGNDRLADLAVGRLPANNLADANLMVNKIINYEAAPPAGSWRNTLGFVADDAFDANGTPDPAGNFENMVEDVISLVPAGYTAERVYYDPYAADDSGEAFRHRTPAETTQAIIDTVNDGLLFLNYTGHAARNAWSHQWLLVTSHSGRNDVSQMTNGGMLPVSLDMACLSGDFADPIYTAVQEMLLEKAGGGSVGGWAATGFGVAHGHDSLHKGFYKAIFDDDVTVLGLAAVAGKQNLWAERGASYADLQDTFGLLGDPALQFNLPDTVR